MCDKCQELEKKIERSRRVVASINDSCGMYRRSLIMERGAEDWRDWVVHVSDDSDDELFVLPFVFVLDKPHSGQVVLESDIR